MDLPEKYRLRTDGEKTGRILIWGQLSLLVTDVESRIAFFCPVELCVLSAYDDRPIIFGWICSSPC